MSDRYEAPMTPENPKKMWIFTWVSDDTEVGPGVGWEASLFPHAMRERSRGFGPENASEPAEYVRKDLVEAEKVLTKDKAFANGIGYAAGIVRECIGVPGQTGAQRSTLQALAKWLDGLSAAHEPEAMAEMRAEVEAIWSKRAKP